FSLQFSASENPFMHPVLGASIFHEVADHYAYDGARVQDYVGLGASLQIHDPEGNGVATAGKFFMRWVPDDVRESSGIIDVPHPPHDLTRIAHAYMFPNTFSAKGMDVGSHQTSKILLATNQAVPHVPEPEVKKEPFS